MNIGAFIFNLIFLDFIIFQYSHCFLHKNDHWGDWESLKIVPINLNAENGAKLPNKINNILHSAIKNIGQIIYVSPSKIVDNGEYIKTIQKCLEIEDDKMEMAKWAKAIKNANAEFANLNGDILPNFHLFIQLNLPSICHSPNSLSDILAAAAPCFPTSSDLFNQRPIFGKLIICAQKQRWKYYRAGMDIFRHEILHSLGFGMILPPSNQILPSQQQKKWNNYWRLAKGNFLHRPIHFMDFSTKAIHFGREHFNCQKMKGIEANDELKMHLSEYLFGNELMTPILNGGPNYLTMFSALILEETFIGNHQWYRTNREIVERETRAFWWGRGFGCEFLEKSCFELAKKSRKWPFCGEEELEEQYFDGMGEYKELCFSNGTNSRRKYYKCQLLDENEMQWPNENDDGIMKPISLSSQFPSIFGNVRIFGSEFDNFYCPMVENQFDDQQPQINSFLVECKEQLNA